MCCNRKLILGSFPNFPKPFPNYKPFNQNLMVIFLSQGLKGNKAKKGGKFPKV